MKKKRILVAPLNWGLGHATRCIPIIRALLAQGAEVLLASDGRALDLLRQEFPELKSFALPPYNIHYKWPSMMINMALQLPKLARAIYREHRAIQKLAKAQALDLIISDNRFGCFHDSVPSIFMTHQLNIITPDRLSSLMVNGINHFMIRRFHECWVPDYEGATNLAGRLSERVKGLSLRYLGPLSRMQFQARENFQYDLIAILSGPEPQRTYFEETIVKQLLRLPYRVLIVQGRSEQRAQRQLSSTIDCISFLTATELNQAILDSEVVLARTGYSTLMDLEVLAKKAILVPTPGQTEQAYLGKRWRSREGFAIVNQDQLNIKQQLDVLKNSNPPIVNNPPNIQALISHLLA